VSFESLATQGSWLATHGFKKTTMHQKLAILLLLGLALVACKKDDPDPVPTDDSSFGLLQQKVLTKSCALAGCHASTADNSHIQHQLVLKGDGVYAALVNGPVKNAQAVAAGLKQVAPNDLNKSFFYQKLIFAQSAFKFGNAMPLGADALSAKQLEFIRQWINAGAPRTGNVADKTLLD
jgi:hypothetical protein